MKSKLLIGLQVLFCLITIKAQVFNITVDNNGQCYSASGNTTYATRTAGAPSAVSYSWAVLSSNTLCPASFTVSPATGIAAIISFPCCGTYTVVHAAYGSGPNPPIIAMVSVIYTVNCAPSPNISLINSTGTNSICLGNTTTLSASGASLYSWSTGATSNSISVTPTISTTYSVTGTTGSCSTTKTIDLTVNPNPTLSINGFTIICANESTTLNALGAVNYTWSNSVNSPSIVISPTVTSTYSVVGTGANGCQATKSATVVFNGICGGIEKNNDDSVFNFFPNPATNELTIQNSSEIPANYSINDLNGKIILKGTVIKREIINTSNLANGSYILILQQPSYPVHFKIQILN